MIEEKKYLLDSPNYMISYFLDNEVRPHIVLTPGGAYHHCSKREGKPVADVFLKAGYNVTIVEYRETTDFYPYPGKCLADAFNNLRSDKRVSKLIGMGFSAGGHLMLDVSLHHEEYHTSKPDYLILGYPVVTTKKKYWHGLSFELLLGDKFNDEALLKHLSLEREVTKAAPELFLWNTVTDESVNAKNSILLLEAYYKNKVNVEYHLYQKGPHGIALANKASSGGEAKYIVPVAQNWPKLAINWLNDKLNK